jgi:hypothetical protein
MGIRACFNDYLDVRELRIRVANWHRCRSLVLGANSIHIAWDCLPCGVVRCDIDRASDRFERNDASAGTSSASNYVDRFRITGSGVRISIRSVSVAVLAHYKAVASTLMSTCDCRPMQPLGTKTKHLPRRRLTPRRMSAYGTFRPNVQCARMSLVGVRSRHRADFVKMSSLTRMYGPAPHRACEGFPFCRMCRAILCASRSYGDPQEDRGYWYDSAEARGIVPRMDGQVPAR